MSAELLERLAEAGTPMALIMEVAEALAEARAAERLLATRREKDAARQQEKREREKVANHVTSRDSADITDVTPVAPAFDKETSPRPPKEIKSTPCVRTAREARYHRLPEGWVPTRPLPSSTQAKVDLWPPGAFEAELAALHRWAVNAKPEKGKGLKLDWDQALVNWIERRDDERYSRTRGNGMGGHKPSDGLSATARAGLDVFGASPAGH